MQHLVPWLRLQLTPGLGRVGMIRLIERFKTPEQAIDNAGDWHLAGLRNGLARAIPASTDSNVDNACERLNEMQGRLLTMWDADYPHRLRQISDPPALLYCCGELPAEPALAIVGTRHPTEFGRMFTKQLAGEIAATGIVIASGMARGIDSAAHRGALDEGGKTIAVLGCGIDRWYPASNTRLGEEILEAGGAIVSEYAPGTPPAKYRFPLRNRIVSGMSAAVIVTEAAVRSGALITARVALEQGREVLALPGDLDRATSEGTNRLIADGAVPVTSVEDAVEAVGRILGMAVETSPEHPLSDLLGPEAALDDLPARLGVSAPEALALVGRWELEGRVRMEGGRVVPT